MNDTTIGRDRLGEAGDDIYAALMSVHEGLTLEESMRLNARLVLLLANEVGDPERVKALLEQDAKKWAPVFRKKSCDNK